MDHVLTMQTHRDRSICVFARRTSCNFVGSFPPIHHGASMVMLSSQPILGVRTRQTYQSALNEYSRRNGAAGYCIESISAASIFDPTTAAAMVALSSLLFFFDLASQLGKSANKFY